MAGGSAAASSTDAEAAKLVPEMEANNADTVADSGDVSKVGSNLKSLERSQRCKSRLHASMGMYVQPVLSTGLGLWCCMRALGSSTP